MIGYVCLYASTVFTQSGTKRRCFAINAPKRGKTAHLDGIPAELFHAFHSLCKGAISTRSQIVQISGLPQRVLDGNDILDSEERHKT